MVRIAMFTVSVLLWGCDGEKDRVQDTASGGCQSPTSWYADSDGDGHGSANDATEACAAPDGTVSSADDCDDTDAAVSPDAAEIWYDGADQDCSGGSDFDQDGDTHDTTASGGDDCDDTDAATNPDAAEIWYDGVDQDCSGDSDFDQDGDAHEAAASGGDDCDDTNAAVNPDLEDEPCNGLDDDCNGAVDDVEIALVGGTDWVTSTTAGAGWNEVGYDDSAWTAAITPAPESCGWFYSPDTIGRAHEDWEHAGTQTMWSADGATHIYLRLTFELPAGAAPTLAMLTSIVDDEHTVYLNGVEVGADEEPDGVPVVETDLTSALVEGENVLAIDAEDLGGCRWALVDGAVSCAP